nr:hypothetical protein CTI12_AA204890 [Tanacetum cinerariifolium]
MTVARLSKMLQGTCMFPVKGIFFLVSCKELSNGLIQIKNDLDLANCIAIGYKNGKVIDMFLEHHGYDLSYWIQTDIDNNDDKISDVEMEDITGYADYRKQLLDTNPGSSVHLHLDEKDDGKIYFKRIYICFKAMIEGWSAVCRKVIGLDGCFLKSTCRGELLTAMGRDGIDGGSQKLVAVCRA